MSDGWVITEQDRETAKHGIEQQAEAMGLDLFDYRVQNFITHQTEVIASWAAQVRWQQNIIHAMTFTIKEPQCNPQP